jgi:hypothetical protein
MRMRSHAENPGIRRLARTARTRWRPILLVTGGLLLVAGMAFPVSMAFVPGMLVVALGAPDTRPHVPTAAMVGAWAWLHESRAPGK